MEEENGAQSPLVRPFKYVLIPADDNKEVVEMRYDGGSDGEFRASLQNYFRRQLLSESQKTEMAKHLVEKAKDNTNNSQGGSKNDIEAAAAVSSDQQEKMIADYLDQTSFEIVPLIMPLHANKYIGISIYIDDSGRFKELALNSRASRVAQRDIRGDAFLLSSHDDPAMDEWSRVDCNLDNYKTLLANPPTTQYDTSNRAQMASAAMLRESSTKRISEEDIVKAMKARSTGNAHFKAGDLSSAVKAYGETVDLTEGRRDLLANEAEVTSLRVTALLNRSLCLHKLGKHDDAAHDAQTAIDLEERNVKAHYRLAVALCGSRDYKAAESALERCEKIGGITDDTGALRNAIIDGRKRFEKEQKQKYAKLFA